MTCRNRFRQPDRASRRTHSDQQVAQIAASIREFGFTNPVLIDEEDGIIAGAGRVLAAHPRRCDGCDADFIYKRRGGKFLAVLLGF